MRHQMQGVEPLPLDNIRVRTPTQQQVDDVEMAVSRRPLQRSSLQLSPNSVHVRPIIQKKAAGGHVSIDSGPVEGSDVLRIPGREVYTGIFGEEPLQAKRVAPLG